MEIDKNIIDQLVTKINNNTPLIYEKGKTEGVEEGREEGYNNGLDTAIETQEEFLEGKPQTYYDLFWDAYQENGNRKKYRYAFSGNGWASIDLAKEMKYDIKIVDTASTSRHATGMFFNFNRDGGNNLYDMSELCKRLDFSDCIDGSGIFQNTRVDKVMADFSNATALTSTFAGGDGGGAIETLTLKVSNKCSFGNTFNYCSNLKNLTFMEGSEIASSLNLKWSTSLTKTSVENVINTLSSTITTPGLTVTFSITAVNNAFETAKGLADGSTSAEWIALAGDENTDGIRPNWTISLV